MKSDLEYERRCRAIRILGQGAKDQEDQAPEAARQTSISLILLIPGMLWVASMPEGFALDPYLDRQGQPSLPIARGLVSWSVRSELVAASSSMAPNTSSAGSSNISTLWLHGLSAV